MRGLFCVGKLLDALSNKVVLDANIDSVHTIALLYEVSSRSRYLVWV